MMVCLLLVCDIFTLKSGGKLDGVERSRKDGKVIIEVAAGTATVDESEIASFTTAPSKVGDYYERADKLKESKDAASLMALASWAKENGVGRFAAPLYERILAVDPTHELAHRGLGHERVGAQWMTHDDAMRERGHVEFEGRWVVPQERELILAARDAAKPKKAEKREVVARRVVREESLTFGPSYPYRDRYDRWYPWWYGHSFWHVRVAPGTVIAPDITTLDFGSSFGGPSGYRSMSPASASSWWYPNYQIYQKK